MTKQEKIVNIALFASGSGSNLENIINKLKDETSIKFPCLICNNPNAYVLSRAKKLNLDSLIISKEDFQNPEKLFSFLNSYNINLIVLAGFLWLIPRELLMKYKIINIHPALLPKYGGKGMFGDKVHKAVFENKEKETGITIHYVNEQYDEGQIIFQKAVEIDKEDSELEIANKVHQLEYEHFPEVIRKLASELASSKF